MICAVHFFLLCVVFCGCRGFCPNCFLPLQFGVRCGGDDELVLRVSGGVYNIAATTLCGWVPLRADATYNKLDDFLLELHARRAWSRRALDELYHPGQPCDQLCTLRGRLFISVAGEVRVRSCDEVGRSASLPLSSLSLALCLKSRALNTQRHQVTKARQGEDRRRQGEHAAWRGE